MIVHNKVERNAYYDSVTLMLFSSRMAEVPGIRQAAAMMGTEHNKSLMIHSGILSPQTAEDATPNDMIVGIMGETQQSVDQALALLAQQFEEKKQTVSQAGQRAKTLDSAVKKLEGANFAVISLPGKYAKGQVAKAMEKGLHVLLFSDNVSLEDEIELKNYAVAHNLLMMGPDCGTAIINGVALGFANVVKRGDIGLVAASGTGLQEATVIIDRMGCGISQALGTGGRDLKEAVGGKMMLLALEALKNDPSTRIIGIVSKPPAKEVMEKILDFVKTVGKPVVTCFLGGSPDLVEGTGAIAAQTLEDAAVYLAALSKGQPVQPTVFSMDEAQVEEIAEKEARRLGEGQKYIRGLYSGGTLCFEAMLLLDELGELYSNIAIHPDYALADVETSQKNTMLDMGEDYFTDGMPHPMIDPRLRVERIKKEMGDPDLAVLLLDCVMGYGSHDNPAGVLAQAIEQARAATPERYISVVASVCGTEADRQNRSRQEEILRQAGVIVMPSNAQAVRMAARILAGAK